MQQRVRRGSAALVTCVLLAGLSVTAVGRAGAAATPPGSHAALAPVRLGTMRRPTGSRASSLLADYIVRTIDLVSQHRLVAWAAAHGVTVSSQFGAAIDGATLTMSDAQAKVVTSLEGVASVERDRPVHLAAVEGSAPWGLDRIDQRSAALDASYRYAATGAGVKAYVVDTGLRLTHTDFTGRVGTGGFVDFGDNTGVTDCKGHGTHTSGTLGGTVYGVAKGVTIVPVKVLDCGGNGSNQTVIAGLNWVLSDHQPGEPAVVNMSLGGVASADVDAAVQKLIDAGITVVAAAGNEAVDACGSSPARVPAAITVGAVDRSDTEAPFSNYGSCVDIFAPGVDITSDWFSSDTAAAIASGTSMAAPHVAGAVALILQAHPTYTPAQVWNLLSVTATTNTPVFQAFDVGSPSKVLYTGPIAVPVAPARPSITAGNTALTVSWSAPTFDGNMPLTGYRVQRSTDGVTWSTVATVKPTSHSVLASGLHNGVGYRFRVAALNFVGIGPDSAVSVVVAPRTQPSGVGRVAVQALNRAALLTWPAPASDGGAMVRNYRIQRSTDGVTWHTVTSTAPISRAFTVTGLTNGVRYRFRVAAANIAGPGAWSAAAVVTPRPVASAPGRPTGTAGSRKVTLRWSAPASPGGSAITGYRLLKSVNGITWLVVTATAPTTRTFTVSGLTNGVAYRFRVAAVNGVGLGAWSSVGIATPHA